MLSGAALPYPRTHNLVMLTELLRSSGGALPPDANDFGRLLPYGVVLRYEDATEDPPPAIDPRWFEAIVSRPQ